MKRVVMITLIGILIGVLAFMLISCADNNSNGLDDYNETQQKNRTVKIDNEALFNYYFTLSVDNNYIPRYSSNSYYYGDATKSTSLITVTPKLTGFVDYHGYIFLKPVTDNEEISPKILFNRHINIDYWGEGSDYVEKINNDSANDISISFEEVAYTIDSVEITITYHDEGASGNSNLIYESVELTKYNYKYYLNISIVNNKYSTVTYDENDIYHRNPITTYYYYQTYSISPNNQIKGLKEFKNIKLIFDNGTTITLDSLGVANYRSSDYSAEREIPNLAIIEGTIDFYPPAIYEFYSYY